MEVRADSSMSACTRALDTYRKLAVRSRMELALCARAAATERKGKTMRTMKQRGTWQLLATAAVLATALLAAPAAWADGPVKMVNAGFGLSGGGSGPVVNLAVDPTQIQVRVSGVCASGLAMRAIAGDGTVTCVPVGTITAVNAGAGLT